MSTPRRLGVFEIVGPLGAGGMGEVYRAHDPRLQRDVALKLLPIPHVGDEEARARLLREARAAAALNHPHICTILEVGETDGRAFIVMELIEGQPLDRAIPTGGLPAADVFAYAVQIADAVAHAHDGGVLHRDLKTPNIMVTATGRVKVLDFGLAWRIAGEQSTFVTEAGRIAGTMSYVSPEQLRGQPATAASDVWALGIVLYEMATGHRPFVGSTGLEVASAILNQSPPPLPTSVPSTLRGIVSRCLSKSPAGRYQTAGELRAALQAAQASTIDPYETLGPFESPAQIVAVPSPGRWVAAIAAITILVLVNIFAVPFCRDRGALPPRVAAVALLPLEDKSDDAEDEYQQQDRIARQTSSR